jgi:hypothetical protein
LATGPLSCAATLVSALVDAAITGHYRVGLFNVSLVASASAADFTLSMTRGAAMVYSMDARHAQPSPRSAAR